MFTVKCGSPLGVITCVVFKSPFQETVTTSQGGV